MKRDYRDYLEDILAAIDESSEFTRDISFEIFARDRRTVIKTSRSNCLLCARKSSVCLQRLR